MKLLSLCAIFIMLSCSSSTESNQKHKLKDYFPLTVGNYWVYQSKDNQITKQVEKEFKDANGNTAFEISTTTSLGAFYNDYYSWHGEGLWLYDSDKIDIIKSDSDLHKYLYLKLNMEVGTKWTLIEPDSLRIVTIKFLEPGEHNIYSEINSTVLDTIFKDVAFLQSPIDSSFHYYYAKNVGLIQLHENNLVINSYNVFK